MNLAPKKLTAAHALLVDLLSHGRSMMVASCVALAAEAGLSMRTLFEARRRLPVECDRVGDGPGSWRLADAPAAPPEQWKPRKLRHCIGCGEPLVGHWRQKRCRACGGRPR
jgi:hypothetical protein